MKATRILATSLLTLAALSAASTLHAAVFVVPEAQLTVPTLTAADVVDFSEVPNGTFINGQTIDGFTFAETTQVTQVGVPGPGNTNHLTQPHAANNGGFNPGTFVLTVTMPGYSSAFGLGFAINTFAVTANALTITLFDGVTNVGSLVYGGSPDPTFSGGFAGIGSTIAFNSAQITFGPSVVAFAIDNVASVPATAAVPEPGSALVGMLVLGVCGLGGARRRRSAAVAQD